MTLLYEKYLILPADRFTETPKMHHAVHHLPGLRILSPLGCGNWRQLWFA